MSLSVRLNLLITILLVFFAVAGVVSVVMNARNVVAKEIDSTANLTLELLVAATIASGSANQRVLRSALMDRLARLEQVRHLEIAMLGSDGRSVGPALQTSQSSGVSAPQWFVRLVAPPPVEYRHRLSSPGIPYAAIAIRTDPSAEIVEAWQESRALLMLLAAFAALTGILISWSISRAFRPIEEILETLGVIEGGDYSARVGSFAMPEMNRISHRVNRMAQTLQRKGLENRALRKRNLIGQEAERRHLARELHDELGQSVSAIKALAVSISRGQQQSRAARNDSPSKIVAICDHVYDVVRQMMQRLRPVVLDELGLETALTRAVDDWNAHHADVRCTLRVSGLPDRLGDDISINCYRVVQECLTNVARHARASTVDVTLTVAAATAPAPSRLVLEVVDNGCGFDAASVTEGLGLSGMRERVDSLEGELVIETAPGFGCRLSVSVPLDVPPGHVI